MNIDSTEQGRGLEEFFLKRRDKQMVNKMERLYQLPKENQATLSALWSSAKTELRRDKP